MRWTATGNSPRQRILPWVHCFFGHTQRQFMSGVYQAKIGIRHDAIWDLRTWVIWLTGAKRREFLGMIHNNYELIMIPATPSNPSSNPMSNARTSKLNAKIQYRFFQKRFHFSHGFLLFLQADGKLKARIWGLDLGQIDASRCWHFLTVERCKSVKPQKRHLRLSEGQPAVPVVTLFGIFGFQSHHLGMGWWSIVGWISMRRLSSLRS